MWEIFRFDCKILLLVKMAKTIISLFMVRAVDVKLNGMVVIFKSRVDLNQTWLLPFKGGLFLTEILGSVIKHQIIFYYDTYR